METDAFATCFSEYPYYGNTVAETLLLMGFVYHLAQILRKRIDE
jgi:hypothetical protein